VRTAQRLIVPVVLVWTACCLAWFLLPGRARPADPPKRGSAPRNEANEILKTGKFAGAFACAECHTQPIAARRKSLDFVLLTEYAIWATHDKHAQAQAVLTGPRGKKIAENLGQNVLAPETGCLGCHSLNVPRERWGKGFALDNFEGVTCGSCHGPSRNQKGEGGWHDKHTERAWRDLSPAQKEDLGMRDLRDPAKRAALCASCHIGNVEEGKVLTHTMFAAGHPPLPPFEAALFSRNQPKHWRDARDVPFFNQDPPAEVIRNYDLKDKDYQWTRQALVGQVVALRETMRLVRDRSVEQADDPGRVWPELWKNLDGTSLRKGDKPSEQFPDNRWPELAMAHSDCYACHHELQTRGSRQQRGFGYRVPGAGMIPLTPGRPVIRAWPLAGIELCVRATGDARSLFPSLAEKLTGLAKTTSARPFGDPNQLHRDTQAVMDWCDRVIAALQTRPYDDTHVLEWLHALGKLEAVAQADYETARQLGSLFWVLVTEWDRKRGAAGKNPELAKGLQELSDSLNLEPYTHRRDRLKVVLTLVRKLADPAAKITDQDLEEFSKYTVDVGDEALLKAMQRNRFLTELVQIEPDKIAKLLQGEKVTELQALSNEELKTALQKIAAYRADAFQQKLTRLCGLLPSVASRSQR
jgi:hypothetical protein